MASRQELFGPVHVPDDSLHVGDNAQVQAEAARSPEGLFEVLPRDVLLHILNILCRTPDMTAGANRGMATFRLVRPTYSSAANAATLVVFLYSADQFRSAIPYLSKLAAVTDISLSVTIKLLHTPHSGSHPELSLAQSLRKGAEIPLTQRFMSAAIWQTLKRLEMFGMRARRDKCMFCTNGTGKDSLFEGTSTTGSGNKGDWCLDLRTLQTLIINSAPVRLLELSKCPNLRELKLEDNPFLVSVDGSSSHHLYTIVCEHNSSLTSLDLTGCDGLLTFKCDKNEQLSNLVLGACTKLEHVMLNGTHYLMDADLSPCTSLQRLECKDNSALTSLRVPLCPNLTSVDCSSNCSLLHLNLSHQLSLERLTCVNNLRLIDCHLFKCSDLRYAQVSENVGLHVLNLTGCTTLERLQCCNNIGLVTLQTHRCNVLKDVECSHCLAMTELDLSRCFMLTKLICTDNVALTSLNISGCTPLQVLSMRGCLTLGAVDMSGCPILMDVTLAPRAARAKYIETIFDGILGAVFFVLLVMPMLMCAYCLLKLLVFLKNCFGV